MGVVLGHLPPLLDLLYLTQNVEQETLPGESNAVAGAGPAKPFYPRGAPANAPDPMTTKKARHLLNDNELEIECDASFLKNLIFN